jgi:hypothetical protein
MDATAHSVLFIYFLTHCDNAAVHAITIASTDRASTV